MKSVIVNKNGQLQSVQGENAVNVFRIRTLISALKLIESGIKPYRGFTLKHGLELATQYTGNSYKRNELGKAKEELYKIMQSRLKHITIVGE